MKKRIYVKRIKKHVLLATRVRDLVESDITENDAKIKTRHWISLEEFCYRYFIAERSARKLYKDREIKVLDLNHGE